MSERHVYHDVNPKHLDCGELIDASNDEYIWEATADQARRSIRRRRREVEYGDLIFVATVAGPCLARVKVREGTPIADFRLGIALKFKAECRLFGRPKPWRLRA